jgi:hypothetical protein
MIEVAQLGEQRRDGGFAAQVDGMAFRTRGKGFQRCIDAGAVAGGDDQRGAFPCRCLRHRLADAGTATQNYNAFAVQTHDDLRKFVANGRWARHRIASSASLSSQR